MQARVAVVGTDRRRCPFPQVGLPFSRNRLSVVLVGLAVLAVAPSAAALGTVHVDLVGDAWPAADVAVLAGAAAISLWFAVWSTSGHVWPAYLALALVPSCLLLAFSASPLAATGHQAALAAVAVVPAVTAAAVLVRALRVCDVPRTSRLGPALGGLAVAVVGMVTASAVAGAAAASSLVVPSAGAGAVLGWLLAAGACRRTGAMAWAGGSLVVAAMLAFALAAADRVVAGMSSGEVTASWASGSARLLALLGWLMLAGAALRSLAVVRALASDRPTAVPAVGDAATRDLAERLHLLEERQHDLHSLVAGIEGATTTLARYGACLGPGERAELESALVAEVARLRRSFGAAQIATTSFELRSVVEPVITAERLRGASIRSSLADVDVLASPDATAAIMQNLLGNARRHAPGALVTVSVRVANERVVIAVRDDGPGFGVMARSRAEALFAGAAAENATAGGHGPGPLPNDTSGFVGAGTGTGHGLGLGICARLAREDGCELRFGAATAGTCIELWLRAARPEPIEKAGAGLDAVALAAKPGER